MGFETEAALLVGEELFAAEAATAVAGEAIAADVAVGAVAGEAAAGAVAGEAVAGAVGADAIAAAGASGFDALTGAAAFDEFAGVDAAIAANSVAGGATATASLPELMAAQGGGFALSATEVAAGFSIVNAASGLVQKLDGAGRVVAQSRPQTVSRYGAIPGNGLAYSPTAQGVTGADINAQRNADQGKTTFSNTTLMAVAALAAAAFFFKGAAHG